MTPIPVDVGSGASPGRVDHSEAASAAPVEPVERHWNVVARVVLARVEKRPVATLETWYSSVSPQTQTQIRIPMGLGNVVPRGRVAGCVPIPTAGVAGIARLHDPRNGSHSGQAVIRRMVWSRARSRRSSPVRARPVLPSPCRNRCHCTAGEGASRIPDRMTAVGYFLTTHPQPVAIADCVQDPVPRHAVADCLVSE